MPVIVETQIVSSYGYGLQAAWDGLLSGKTAIAACDRFPTDPFLCQKAAMIPGLDAQEGRSFVDRMLRRLLRLCPTPIPRDACMYAASTVGEIDLLMQDVTNGKPADDASTPIRLADRIAGMMGIDGKGVMVSAACASSTIALALAASAIRRGDTDCAVVVAADAVTEFVFAGFSALMALDPNGARPFDKERRGLSLGEAAGYLLLMSSDRARREGRRPLARISGWGMNNDAHHLTGPDGSGKELSRAIRSALQKSGAQADGVDAICAHGTGTVFNDAMEMKAFQRVFHERRVPVFSIKGAIGHTLGAAGLVEAAVLVKTLAHGILPGTVGLEQTDELARGYASPEAVAVPADTLLTTNSGFGGINAALLITRVKD